MIGENRGAHGYNAQIKNMNALKSFVIAIFGVAVAIAVSILVAIKGWGLEPKSYGWIIGVSFFGHLIAQLLIEIAKSDK